MPSDTIVALATPWGQSAIAVIRLSGSESISLVNQLFEGKDLCKQAGNTTHFGTLHDGGKPIDEVVVSLFRAPRSFTKEDSVELSCHGAPYIIRTIIQLLIAQGARPAEAGEFTKRAFLHGQFDLAQAEAVADIIAADNAQAHRVALHQLKGGITSKMAQLRKDLVHCTAMLELSLDFGEEEVDFVDYPKAAALVRTLLAEMAPLIASFAYTGVVKEGIHIAIIGKPNAGKSTLLNALLQEERALVSSIPGTTRDTIEGSLTLGGISFRIIDTAGIRATQDEVEALGIAKTMRQRKEAAMILQLFDLDQEDREAIAVGVEALKVEGRPFVAVGNKMDLASEARCTAAKAMGLTLVGARAGMQLPALKEKLTAAALASGLMPAGEVVVNARHYRTLLHSRAALEKALAAIMARLGNEMIIIELQEALAAVGEITGDVTHEHVLDEIFAGFCIGK